jgi:hypothetical protein
MTAPASAGVPDPGAGQAVFVSDTSPRARAMRWAGRVAALLAIAYVVITAGGLVGASWVPKVSLPGVGPVTLQQHPDASPSLGTTAQPLATPDLTRSPAGTSRVSGTTSTVVSRGAGIPGATTTAPRTRNASGPSTTANPGGHTPGQGKTSTTQPSKDNTSPGKSGSAPGHTSSTVHGH